MDKFPRKGKLELFLNVWADPDRKRIIQIIKEIIKLLLINRELPGHYFTGYLFKKGVPKVENYLPTKLAARIAPRLNDQKLKEVLDNKLYFNLFYTQFEIETPSILMFNHGRSFYRNNEVFLVDAEDDFVLRLRELFEQNPSMPSVIVKKIYSSSKGADIYKISAKEIGEHKESINDIYQDVIRSEFIFQETIIQHSKVSVLNPSSVNTIRMDTLLDGEGKVHVLSGYIRMSLKSHFVDNIGNGGCRVGVDLGSGTLRKYAYPDFNYYGTEIFTRHPITGTVFEGFKLPYIDEAKALITRAALLMPGLRIVGWDVAIGVDGPVIIEGNSDYGIRGNDLTYGGYRAHPVFRKVLEEIF